MIRSPQGCLRPAAASLLALPSYSRRGDLQHRISQLLISTHRPSSTDRHSSLAPLQQRRSNHHLSANEEWMRRHGIPRASHDAQQSSSPAPHDAPGSQAAHSLGGNEERLPGFFDRAIPLDEAGNRADTRAPRRIQARRRYVRLPKADEEAEEQQQHLPALEPHAAWERFTSLDEQQISALPAFELMHLWWTMAEQDLGVQPKSTSTRQRPDAPHQTVLLLDQLDEIQALLDARPGPELKPLAELRVLAAHRALYIRNTLSEQTSFYDGKGGDDDPAGRLRDEASGLINRVHDLGYCLETGLLTRLTRSLLRRGGEIEALRMLERDTGPGGPKGRVEVLLEGDDAKAPPPDLTKALLKALGELIVAFRSALSKAESTEQRDRTLHRALKVVEMVFSIAAAQGRGQLLDQALEALRHGSTQRNELLRLMDRRELKALLPPRVRQEMEEQDLPGPGTEEEREYRAPLWLDRVLSPRTKGLLAEELCIILARKRDLAPAIAYLRIASQPQDVDDDEGRLIDPEQAMPPLPTSHLSFMLISLLRHRMGGLLTPVLPDGSMPTQEAAVELDLITALLMRVYKDLTDAGIVPDAQCHADMIQALAYSVRFGWERQAHLQSKRLARGQEEEERPPKEMDSRPVSRLEESFNRFIQAFVPEGHRPDVASSSTRQAAASATPAYLLRLRQLTSSLLKQDPSLDDTDVVSRRDVRLLFQLHVELADAAFSRRLFESIEASRLARLDGPGEGPADDDDLFIPDAGTVFLLRSAMQERPPDVTFALRVLSHALHPRPRPRFILPRVLASKLVSAVLRRGDSAIVGEAWARLGEVGTRLGPRLAATIVEALADSEEPQGDTILDVAEQLELLPVAPADRRDVGFLLHALALALDASSRAFVGWTPERRERLVRLFERFRLRVADLLRQGEEVRASVVRMAYHAAVRALIGEAALEVGHFDEPPSLAPSPFSPPKLFQTPEEPSTTDEVGRLLHELTVLLGIPPDYQTVGLQIVADIVPDRRLARERFGEAAVAAATMGGETPPLDSSELFEAPLEAERLDRALHAFQSSLGATEYTEGSLRASKGLSQRQSQTDEASADQPKLLSFSPEEGAKRVLRLRSGVTARLVICLGRSGRFKDAQYVYDAWKSVNDPLHLHHHPASRGDGRRSELREDRASLEAWRKTRSSPSSPSSSSQLRPLTGRRPFGLEGALLGILAMQGRSEEWKYRLERLKREEGYELSQAFNRLLKAWDRAARHSARLAADGGAKASSGLRGGRGEEGRGKAKGETEWGDEDEEERRRMRDVFRRLASGQPARRRWMD